MEPPLRPARRSFGFPTTRWSLVVTLRSKDPEQVRRALQELVVAYRAPLLAYLRCLGVNFDDVQDTLHDFLANAIEKQTLGRADPDLGRFRSFLKACVENFVKDLRDKARRQKRGGDISHVGIDGLDEIDLPKTSLTASAMFERIWAMTVLSRAVAVLAQSYKRRNRTLVFEAIVPVVTDGEPLGGYAAISAATGLSPGAVKVAVHRLREELAARVRAQIADTVLLPEDVESEFRVFRSALGLSAFAL